jgi:flagella basal body P-ring formation protein FlgA
MLGQIGPPALVERNSIVRMNYSRGPLRIVTDGRALDRAAVGETVRVMNLSSKQTVTGTVAPDGSIEVGQ